MEENRHCLNNGASLLAVRTERTVGQHVKITDMIGRCPRAQQRPVPARPGRAARRKVAPLPGPNNRRYTDCQ